MKTDKRTNSGGNREGSGRKPNPDRVATKAVLLRLDPKQADWVKSNGGAYYMRSLIDRDIQEKSERL